MLAGSKLYRGRRAKSIVVFLGRRTISETISSPSQILTSEDRELTPAAGKCSNQNSDRGRLAQLGERGVRNAEAEGSNPLPSTSTQAVLIILLTCA
jgi:hypothetical protein